MRFTILSIVSILFLASCATASGRNGAAGSGEADPVREAAMTQFGVLPSEIPAPAFNPTTPEKVELGKMLFFEPRLSFSQSISCNSCHNLAAGGTDNLPKSLGHGSVQGGRNSPTVLNAGFHVAQFWDGRAMTLEEQASGPITNPVEMAMPVDPEGIRLMKVLRSIPEYEARFAKVFGDKAEPINMQNITFAIAAFERTLATPGRFDRWLEGDNSALNDQEKRGLQTFLDTGCTACHSGPALGGEMFQQLGLVKPWPNQKDQGRFDVTGDESDRMSFKVMPLRNIALTAPYFHDASAWTLEEAVALMAEHQLGQELETAQVNDIVAFLGALTGDLPTITLPRLPPSTAETPKPELPAPGFSPETAKAEKAKAPNAKARK